ncbi:MAG TPA: hypothetical protein VN041_04955 [Microbacterium sp.]|nr:hypothetical protein [Microbacterium sp.]
MGNLEYNSSRPPIQVDDITLAHLKVVIGTKLRRQESFMMTWLPDQSVQSGRLTTWMHPAIPLIFSFDSTAMPVIDPKRIEHMMELLNARGDLVLDQMS